VLIFFFFFFFFFFFEAGNLSCFSRQNARGRPAAFHPQPRPSRGLHAPALRDSAGHLYRPAVAAGPGGAARGGPRRPAAARRGRSGAGARPPRRPGAPRGRRRGRRDADGPGRRLLYPTMVPPARAPPLVDPARRLGVAPPASWPARSRARAGWRRALSSGTARRGKAARKGSRVASAGACRSWALVADARPVFQASAASATPRGVVGPAARSPGGGGRGPSCAARVVGLAGVAARPGASWHGAWARHRRVGVRAGATGTCGRGEGECVVRALQLEVRSDQMVGWLLCGFAAPDGWMRYMGAAVALASCSGFATWWYLT
jgi:hypothetical protein